MKLKASWPVQQCAVTQGWWRFYWDPEQWGSISALLTTSSSSLARAELKSLQRLPPGTLDMGQTRKRCGSRPARADGDVECSQWAGWRWGQTGSEGQTGPALPGHTGLSTPGGHIIIIHTFLLSFFKSRSYFSHCVHPHKIYCLNCRDFLLPISAHLLSVLLPGEECSRHEEAVQASEVQPAEGGKAREEGQ